jgi:hypothetical protein
LEGRDVFFEKGETRKTVKMEIMLKALVSNLEKRNKRLKEV